MNIQNLQVHHQVLVVILVQAEDFQEEAHLEAEAAGGGGGGRF